MRTGQVISRRVSPNDTSITDIPPHLCARSHQEDPLLSNRQLSLLKCKARPKVLGMYVHVFGGGGVLGVPLHFLHAVSLSSPTAEESLEHIQPESYKYDGVQQRQCIPSCHPLKDSDQPLPRHFHQLFRGEPEAFPRPRSLHPVLCSLCSLERQTIPKLGE